MPGVFISYRRGDAANAAGRLSDHLKMRLGADQVFVDVDGIELGVDFHEAISDQVTACDALIAVIGPDWVTPRLHEENDFVRIEIATALARNVRVIPVLVDGASMPGVDDLPESLKGLVRRNALEVSHTRFSDDAGKLADALSRIVTGSVARAAAPSPPPVATAPTLPAAGERRLPGLGAHMKRFECADQLFIGEMPELRLAAARVRCGVPEGEPVFAMIDFTVLKNGNDALLVTPAGLRIHHSNGDFTQPQFIPHGELVAQPIEKHGWWQIRLGGTRITVSGGPNRDAVMDFLSAIRAELA